MSRAKQPCRINGIFYPSQVAAARDLGITSTAVYALLRRGYDTYSPLRLHNTKPCSINGVDYPSRAAAAKAFNVTPQTIYRWLRQGFSYSSYHRTEIAADKDPS